ncbi:unnamed protein product [Arctia plantaginis]|uniref:Uncharacterized protein n=1 Tax=Arctia plantaginis TaxID=874455 RepID=A0A8S1AKK2_ARCPL|nr:unnamed protein product [Arctia plantaginis]
MLCGFKNYKTVYQILKSDRINALRKQYDSFLAEDKKRKERNEYILGKLDSMVYANALVPARTKASSIASRPLTMYHIPYQAQVPAAHTVQSTDVKHQLRQDIPIQNIDDTYLIQEVSKKYILIPKLTTPFLNSYLQHAQPICNDTIIEDGQQTINISKTSTAQQPYSNGNSDWKSKYEILNILKNEEKENKSLKFVPEKPLETLLNSTSEKVLSGGDNIVPQDIDCSTNAKEELPEKDNPDEIFNYEVRNDQDISNGLTIKLDPMVHVNTDNFVDTVANIGNKLQKTILDDSKHIEPNVINQSAEETIYVENKDDYNYIEPTDHTLVSEQMHYVEHLSAADPNLDQVEYNYTETGLPIPSGDLTQYAETLEPVHNTNIKLEENLGEPNFETLEQQNRSGNIKTEVYPEEQNAESSEVISANNLMKEMYNNPCITDNRDKDFVDYEPVLDNFTSNKDVKLKSSHDSAREQTGTANPADTTVEQQTPSGTVPELDDQEAIDVVGIQDFNAEQREMFYSDHPVEGYEYQQGDANTNYQEYNKLETYQENEDYPQNENYPHNTNYYNGPVQQDVYPVDVDEDEEHLKLRYDQSYQQQYLDPYEKAYNKNQPEYQEFETDYHPVPTDHIEAIYDQKFCENPEQIEAAINKEEGINEPTHGAVSQAEENKTPDTK